MINNSPSVRGFVILKRGFLPWILVVPSDGYIGVLRYKKLNKPPLKIVTNLFLHILHDLPTTIKTSILVPLFINEG